MSESFENRLLQLEQALKVISQVDNQELQVRSFDYLFGKSVAVVASDGGEHESSDWQADEDGTKKPAKRSRKVAAVSQDKSLEITPDGKQGWIAFAELKRPANAHEKYTTCVYWLLDVAELPRATINQVVSLFIAMKWPLPNNPRNQASQTSRVGYIDSSDQTNLKLTSTGSALVINELPRA